MDRENFFRTACMAGACLCGFPAISSLAKGETTQDQDTKKQISQNWLSCLLTNLDKDLDQEVLRNIVKKSASVHYNQLDMNTVLNEFIGDLDKFIKHLEESWGWKIKYNKQTKELIADENKNYCVCPVIGHVKGADVPALCYCSEGFAEKMFSTVVGVPVTAVVISSVRKGDQTCKYRMVIP